MLESALVGFFLAPRGLRPGLGKSSPPSRFVIFVFHWILFKLMFESGAVKILSGDESWRNLTAMKDYYENCPFPTWIGYYVHHLQSWFHQGTVFYTFLVELIGAAFIFCGRRLRQITFVAYSLFHIGILLTANYTFLNYNAIALSILLLDDQALGTFARLRLPQGDLAKLPVKLWRKITAGAFFTVYLYVTGFLFLATVGAPLNKTPKFMWAPVVWTQSFRSANRYGLFAVMTHRRHHVEFEGSNDGGRTWRTYRYKWQPQDTDQAPRFMAPHLPRFDWNLWFATLSTWKEYPFVMQTAMKLIDQEEDVIALFKENPFEDNAPEIIRFPLYRYRFTELETLTSKGEYWHREPVGYYAPAVTRHPETGKFVLIPNE